MYWTSSFAVHYRDGEKKTGKNVLGEVALDVAHSVEIADVDEGISGAARHARVDLSDNDIGALGRGTGGFDTSTHGAETVLICALRRCEQTDQGEKGAASKRSCGSCRCGEGRALRRRKWAPAH